MESHRFEAMGKGWADTAHTTDYSPASVASSVSDDSGPDPFCRSDIFVLHIVVETPAPPFLGPALKQNRQSSVAPSFLRLLRLFAAKPGPARSRSGEGVFIHRCHRFTQMKEKTGRGQEIVSWPGPHLWMTSRSCPICQDGLVGGALTRRRYPFRLSPRIQISSICYCSRFSPALISPIARAGEVLESRRAPDV